MGRVKLDLSSDEEPQGEYDWRGHGSAFYYPTTNPVSFKRKTKKTVIGRAKQQDLSDEEPATTFKSKLKAVRITKKTSDELGSYQQELADLKANFDHLKTKEEPTSSSSGKKVTFDISATNAPIQSEDFISLAGDTTVSSSYPGPMDEDYDSDLSISEGRGFQDEHLILDESGVVDPASARRADMAEAIYEAQLSASEDDEEDRRGYEEAQFRSSGILDDRDDSKAEVYKASVDHDAHNLALKKLQSVPEIPSLNDVKEALLHKRAGIQAQKTSLQQTLEQYKQEISFVEERQKEVANLVAGQLGS